MASTSQQIVVTIGGVPTVLDVDANLWGTGTVAARPATGDNTGDIYIVQDPPIYRFDVWNGASWVKATVVGPTGGSTDNAIARWDGTGGDVLNNSLVAIDDSGNITGVGTINGEALGTPSAIDWAWEAHTLLNDYADGASIDASPGWVDKVSSVAVTQSTAGDQPVLIENFAKSGYPGVRFDGADDYLFNAGTAPVQSQPYTMFVVAQLYDGTATDYIVDGWAAANDCNISYNGANWLYSAGTSQTTTGRMQGRCMLTIEVNSTTSNAWENRTQVLTASNLGTETIAGIVFGGTSGGTQNFDGVIQGVWLAGGALTEREREEIWTYIETLVNLDVRRGLHSTWAYDSESTADGDPQDGRFRANNAAFGSATELYLNDYPMSGIDDSSFLLSRVPDDWIVLESRLVPGRTQVYQVSGNVVNATSYVKIPVTSIASGNDFEQGEAVQFTFTRGGSEKGLDGMTWEYKNFLGMVDPGTDLFRLNSLTFSLVTQMAISEENTAFSDVKEILGTIKNGDYIEMYSRTQTGRGHIYQVNGTPTDNTGWFLIPLTAIENGTAFSDTEHVYFRFRSGGQEFHNNVPGEISSLTAKGTPTSADFLLIEDAADSNNKKSITVGSLPVGTPAADSVTNAMLTNMAQDTIKGRASGAGTGDPTDLTAAQATAILNPVTSSLKGLAPASGGGTTNFLRADATWAVPPDTTVDTTAIHKATAAEISALTLVSAAPTDHLLIEDASDSNNKKRIAASDLIGLDAPSPAVTGDVLARWDASTSNKIQGSGIGVNDDDQMTSIVTASFIDYMVALAGTTVTIDWNDSASQWIILGASSTFTFTNPPAGSRVMLRVIQDNTGSRTVTWPSTVRWLGGGPPALSETPGDVDVLTFFYDGDVYWGSSAGAAAQNLAQLFADSYTAQLLWNYDETPNAFPSRLSVTETTSASATSHSLSLPAEVNDGDLLLMVFSYDDADTQVSSADADFTEIDAPLDSGNAVTVAAYLRRAAGTEGGGVFALTLSSAFAVQSQCHRFARGTWHDTGTLSDAYTLGTAFVAASDSTPDPPLCNPGTSRKYLFVTWAGCDNNVTVSGIPTNYSGETTTRAGAGTATLTSAIRELEASSDTPDNFTISAAEQSVSQTMAIRPVDGLVLDYSGNGDSGTLTSGTQGGSGVFSGDLGSVATSGPTGYANVAALTTNVDVSHSVMKIFEYTEIGTTLFDIDDSGGYGAEVTNTTGTMYYNDGSNRGSGRFENSIEGIPMMWGWTRTSTTSITIYENGLKYEAVTTGTFSTQTLPEVSDGATATGTGACDGDHSLFAIFDYELSDQDWYDAWLKVSGQKHLWREFVVANGIDSDCVHYLPLWDGDAGHLLDVSGNADNALGVGLLTLRVAALDAFHISCVEGDGTTDYIQTNCTAINVSTTTAWTIAGLCRSDADGDGIFSFGSAGNSIGFRTVATGNIEVYFDDGTTSTQSISKPSGIFAWCVRRNGNTLDWWIDGIKQTALDLTGASFSSNTSYRLMMDIDLGTAASLDGTFQHRGTYDAALADTICELLGEIDLIDQTPVV